MEVSRVPLYRWRLLRRLRKTQSSHEIGNDSRPQTGAFAKFIINKGDTVIRIPDNVSWEAAASIPCAVGTMGLALFKFLLIPFPGLELESVQKCNSSQEDDRIVLIYGGSTATGSIAIQFAKM